MSAHRLTYRDALRLAPVAWLDGEMVTIEGRWTVGFIRVRLAFRTSTEYKWGVCQIRCLDRPNAAARRLLEALNNKPGDPR